MSKAATAKRTVGVLYLLALHGLVIWLLLDKYVLPGMLSESWSAGPVAAPQADTGPQVTPAVIPSMSPTPDPNPTVYATPGPVEPQPGRLLIPVVGVKPEQLTDTFGDSRSEGRTHDAIDIMAPAGTPVIAVADGEIVKFHDSAAGGITIYQISTDKRFFFYYAHLQSRAPGITEGQFIKQGTIIGYVGDTGNAGLGNNHLHFSINAVVDPKRFWDGISVNPYPILKGETSLQ
jgi:murein DD-endopeptidase MepM/ murein hydrolase activator NlpD